MKVNISRTMLVAAAALLFGPAAYAQEINIRAKVPFDFVLGDRAYATGEYAVQTAMTKTNLLSITNENAKTVGQTTSYPCISSKPENPANEAKLVFHRIGNTYFLYRVWIGGSAVGREFPRSHRETEMAMNGSRTQTVIVAGNIVH